VQRLVPAATCIALLAAPAFAQAPLGTSFTYQGRLADAGNPANGLYDFRFVLFDSPAGGAPIGPVVTRDDVVVVDGLFTVGIDFGAVFAGQRRFLEVAVRPGASTGGYDTLTGRQELTPAPSALFGASAPWAGVSGKPVGFADDVDNDLLSSIVCPSGQVLKSNGGVWTCGPDLDTTYTGGPGILVSGNVVSIPTFAITSAMLVDGAVVSVKLADDAVTQAKIADGSVGTAEIVNGSITGAKVAANAISRTQLVGTETAIYAMSAGCASAGSLTTASSCTTLPCGSGSFLNCMGACLPQPQLTCTNTLLGYLLAPSIP
jgi:hypothetical protein